MIERSDDTTMLDALRGRVKLLEDTMRSVAFKLNYTIDGMARHIQVAPEIENIKRWSKTLSDAAGPAPKEQKDE